MEPSLNSNNPTPDEGELRRKLGIPSDANRVLILAESSHWDPNWLHTAEEYYTRWVDPNLSQAMNELERSPRRVYSVECIFFLRMFWERHLELRDQIREFANAGRLRITSSGVTTADTLTPDAEAILRDLALGQKWLRDQGIEVTPRLAYFPDCFGHTPALPSLLNAAGFTMTAFSRLDGMYMAGCDFETQSAFPRAGSSAEILRNQEKSLDFVWRGPDGSQVLAHWNAFTYGQGDMLAYRGITRMYLFPQFLFREDRSDRLVARRIRNYVAQLEPLSRTPYMFCPIGFDFIAPIPDLIPLLERYNQVHYPDTGTWVVNAGLDDYLELVGCSRQKLPVLELDPNPYWTGFYTSRPSLKKRSHQLLNRLLAAESMTVRSIVQPVRAAASGSAVSPDLSAAWWAAATSNHHDFITGTSPDRIAIRDQFPPLNEALAEVAGVLNHANKEITAEAVQTVAPEIIDTTWLVPTWEMQGENVHVTTPFYALEFSEQAGGGIARAWNPETGEVYLEATSNELVIIGESGGLWRMGMEFKGGKFQYLDRSSSQPARLSVETRPEGLEITSSARLGGQTFRIATLCRTDSPLIRCRVLGRAPVGFTIVARFHHGLAGDQLSMENPGGVVDRPMKRIYNPTFWPVQHFWHLPAQADAHGMAILLVQPGAIGVNQRESAIEVITQRNATREKAYGVLPIPACPAEGHELEETLFQYAILFPGTGDWQANRLPQVAREYANGPWIAERDTNHYRHLLQEVILDSDEVWVEAIKPAWFGEGIIVRLWSFTLPTQPITLELRGANIHQAWECDGRECDLRPLTVEGGRVRLTVQRAITSVRLLVGLH